MCPSMAPWIRTSRYPPNRLALDRQHEHGWRLILRPPVKPLKPEQPETKPETLPPAEEKVEMEEREAGAVCRSMLSGEANLEKTPEGTPSAKARTDEAPGEMQSRIAFEVFRQ